MSALKSMILGLMLVVLIVALFRLFGQVFFLEGRSAANLQALAGAGLGICLGWFAARRGGLRNVGFLAVPGLLVLAAITSHFSLAFPNLDPKLDKGFGGLMLWFYGFMLVGGLLPGGSQQRSGASA